ncbi:MAG: mechanosensitive ion channel family protein [Dermatophilaceae bacterium]
MPLSSLSTLTWGQVGDWLLGAPVRIIFTLVIALAVRWLLHRVIARVVESATSRHTERIAALPGAVEVARVIGLSSGRHGQRTRTMGALLRSITTFIVFGIAGLTVMALVGIPLGPMLASAGVGGVALGFGAQSLVKDFLSGIFMILEDQYGVGDVIDTGEATGTVENVTLRMTQLRDAEGVVWYVRNGEITRIANKSQGWSTAVVDMPIAYDEDPERAQELIREVASTMFTDPTWAGRLLEVPTVAGIESISGGAITIRVFAKCRAQQHFAIQRALREQIKQSFDREGVRSPVIFPPYPSAGAGSGRGPS